MGISATPYPIQPKATAIVDDGVLSVTTIAFDHGREKTTAHGSVFDQSLKPAAGIVATGAISATGAVTGNPIEPTAITVNNNAGTLHFGPIYAAYATRICSMKTFVNAESIISIGVYLKKVGAPTGNITVTCRKTSDDSLIGTADTVLDITTITTSYALYTFTWAAKLALPAQATRLCVEYNGGNVSNCLYVRYQNTAYPGDTGGSLYDGTWHDSTYDIDTVQIYDLPTLFTALL